MKYNALYMNDEQKNTYKEYEKKEYELKDKLGVKIVDNATILPATFDRSSNPKLWAIGGVVDSNDNFITESCSRYLFGGYYEHNEDYAEVINEPVIFFGPFIKHWGHFICDQISRLWYILDDPKKYKIAYCGWNWGEGVTDISGNYLELLEKLGISEDQLINIQNPTRFKKVIIPDFSFIPEEFYSKEFEKITDTIVKNSVVKDAKKIKNIYFTRSLLPNNDKERGEDKIMKYLKKHNYEILSPERLSLSEQIYYLNNCENICMISGSISHNIMFCKNNKTNINILNKTDMINGYQMVIDHICNAKITYVDIYVKLKDVLFGMGPFLINISNYMKEWLNDYDAEELTDEDYNWYNEQYERVYSNSKNKETLDLQIRSMGKKS